MNTRIESPATLKRCPWLQIECPKCHAKPGERCFFIRDGARWQPPLGTFFGHNERLAVAPVKIPDGQLNSRREHTLIKGRRYSARCRENRHEMCSRAIRTGHGYRLACQCQCHGDPVAYLPDRPKKAVNPLESTKCQKGKHGECKKVRRLPNNLYASCECACHAS